MSGAPNKGRPGPCAEDHARHPASPVRFRRDPIAGFGGGAIKTSRHPHPPLPTLPLPPFSSDRNAPGISSNDKNGADDSVAVDVDTDIDINIDASNVSNMHASTVEAVSSASFDFPSAVTCEEGGPWAAAEQLPHDAARANGTNGTLRRPASLPRRVSFAKKDLIHDPVQVQVEDVGPASPEWLAPPEIPMRASTNSSPTTDSHSSGGLSGSGVTRTNANHGVNQTRSRTIAPRRLTRPSTLPPRALDEQLSRPKVNRRASFMHPGERPGAIGCITMSARPSGATNGNGNGDGNVAVSGNDNGTSNGIGNGSINRRGRLGGEGCAVRNRRNSMPAFFRKVLTKPEAETWDKQIAPGLLYLPEQENDGMAPAELKLCRFAAMSSNYYSDNLVHHGMPFTVRVVGCHFPNTVRRGLNRVCFSEASVIMVDALEKTTRESVVHDSGNKISAGYCAIPNERSMLVNASVLDEGLYIKEITVNVVLGEIEEACPGASAATLDMALAEGRTMVNKDIRWELAEESKGAAVRRGPAPLRYGYYFILGKPSELKLFCATTTPEHMRLVAQSNGEAKKALLTPTKSLAYVVIRISEA